MHTTSPRSPRSVLAFALALAATVSATAAWAASQDASAVPETGDAAKTQVSWTDLDIDKDGNLSASEAEASPSLKAHFAKADANADGSLTSEEYRQYLAKSSHEAGKQPNPRPQG